MAAPSEASPNAAYYAALREQLNDLEQNAQSSMVLKSLFRRCVSYQSDHRHFEHAFALPLNLSLCSRCANHRLVLRFVRSVAGLSWRYSRLATVDHCAGWDSGALHSGELQARNGGEQLVQGRGQPILVGLPGTGWRCGLAYPIEPINKFGPLNSITSSRLVPSTRK